MKSTAVIRFYKAVFLSKPSNGKKKREKGMAARELVINTQIKQAVHKGRQCNRAVSSNIPGATTQSISLRTPGFLFFFFFSSDKLRKGTYILILHSLFCEIGINLLHRIVLQVRRR